MTFVLNILHENFTMLVADRLATNDQPGTIKIGNITINHGGKLTLTGLQKLALSKQSDLAVGMAGNTGDHRYFGKIDANVRNRCLEEIAETVQAKFLIKDRSEITASGSFSPSSGIATFYDEELSAFLSLYYSFCEIQNIMRWYRGSAQSRLISIGSGGSNFEKAVGLEEIDAFKERVDKGDSTSEIMVWLRIAFRKVSEIDPDVSDTFRVLIATRDAPEFRYLDH